MRGCAPQWWQGSHNKSFAHCSHLIRHEVNVVHVCAARSQVQAEFNRSSWSRVASAVPTFIRVVREHISGVRVFTLFPAAFCPHVGQPLHTRPLAASWHRHSLPASMSPHTGQR